MTHPQPHSEASDEVPPEPRSDGSPTVAPEAMPADELDRLLASPDFSSMERGLLEARELEVAEAMAELEAREADGSDEEEVQAFVSSIKSTWLAETRQTPGSPEGAPSVPKGGRTALLNTEHPPIPNIVRQRGAGKPWGERRGSMLQPGRPGWPIAAAAAAVLLVSWFGFRDAQEDATTPVYLGPGSDHATGAGDVDATGPQHAGGAAAGNRGPSTQPEVLPDIVDFSGEVPEHMTFRIEIHDVTKDRRLDDLVAYDDTTYEPRWTCPETVRATLPPVMRFEVHREVEPPYAAPMWSRVFARQ